MLDLGLHCGATRRPPIAMRQEGRDRFWGCEHIRHSEPVRGAEALFSALAEPAPVPP